MRIKCLRVPEWRSQKETKESRSIATPLSSKDVIWTGYFLEQSCKVDTSCTEDLQASHV